MKNNKLKINFGHCVNFNRALYYRIDGKPPTYLRYSSQKKKKEKKRDLPWVLGTEDILLTVLPPAVAVVFLADVLHRAHPHLHSLPLRLLHLLVARRNYKT